jgi:hypothetical protein
MDTATKLIGKTIQFAELFKTNGIVNLTFTDKSKLEVSIDQCHAILHDPPICLVQFKTQNKEEHFLFIRYLESLGYENPNKDLLNFDIYPIIVVRLEEKDIGGNSVFWEYNDCYNTEFLSQALEKVNNYHEIQIP